jgi:hypothetical protein
MVPGMSVLPPNYEVHVRKAVAHYWETRGSQKKGDDDGTRGGKHLDGFCELVRWLVTENGMPDASIHTSTKLELPGFFRPTKKWDLVVVHRRQLVAAVEFKSQVGSLGNNLNNRTEEALGNATDLWTAYRERAFGTQAPRPWVGWLMLLEDSEDATKSHECRQPHFDVFEEFKGASYAQRYGILSRKLMLERLYEGVALIMSPRGSDVSGDYREPEPDLTMRKFLAGLGAHVQEVLAGT